MSKLTEETAAKALDHAKAEYQAADLRRNAALMGIGLDPSQDYSR